MKKYLFLLCFVLVGLWAQEAPLKVGMELSYPPFEIVCQDGQPCGISLEIVWI